MMKVTDEAGDSCDLYTNATIPGPILPAICRNIPELDIELTAECFFSGGAF